MELPIPISLMLMKTSPYTLKANGEDFNSTETLDVKITGSGDVSYKGNPTITSNIKGSGKLVDAN